MNLNEIYTEGGISALKSLAAEVGCSSQYLYQCATGWNGKRPSPDLALKLVEADPRLTLVDIYQQQSQASPSTGVTSRREDQRSPATAACRQAGGKVTPDNGVSGADPAAGGGELSDIEDDAA